MAVAPRRPQLRESSGPDASRRTAGCRRRVEIALPELEPLETAELDSLLETMDAPQVGTSPLDEPSLNDLDTDELEQVLGTWEG